MTSYSEAVLGDFSGISNAPSVITPVLTDGSFSVSGTTSFTMDRSGNSVLSLYTLRDSQDIKFAADRDFISFGSLPDGFVLKSVSVTTPFVLLNTTTTLRPSVDVTGLGVNIPDAGTSNFGLVGGVVLPSTPFILSVTPRLPFLLQTTPDLPTTATVSGNWEVRFDLIQNTTPEDITLSKNTIEVNSAISTRVGVFRTFDLWGRGHSYSFVSGEGDTNNGQFKFETVGNTTYLTLNADIDYTSINSLSIRVRSTDALGAYREESFTIQIDGSTVNQAPVAQNDTVSAGENATNQLIDVLFNDTDANANDTKTLVSLGAVSVTSANTTINGITATSAFSIVNNQVQFNPGTLFDALAAGQTATVDVNYTMQDSQSAQSSAKLTLTVDGVNDAPTITAGLPSANLVEAGGVANGTLGMASTTIALNTGDVDGTASYDTTFLTSNGWSTADSGATYTKTGTYGSATLTLATGLVAYALNNTSLATQALTQGQSVNDSFTIQVTDGIATESTNAVFSITGSNDAPTVTDETVSTSQNTGNPVTSVTVELGDNLSDPDANGLANAILKVTGTNNVTIDSIDQDARLVTFTPTTGFSGTASFNYTLTDAGELTSNTATVTIEVGSVISLGNRNQEIEGNNGDDIISAGNGSDRIQGLVGKDKLYGNNGNDFLDGGDGNDSLFGGNGTDTLLGGNGDDLLDGGNGTDIVTGGAGADRFVLTTSAGGDTINGFEDGSDRFVLSGGLTFPQLTIASSNGNTLIQLGTTTLATLTGVGSGIDGTDFGTL